MDQLRTKLVVLLAVWLLACHRERPPAQERAQRDTIRNVVDSIFPVQEEIRRFKVARNGVGASELAHASRSRDALVQRFIRAVEARDTADLARMTINAAEFIDLYYPHSAYTKPPYKQSPELFWFLLQQNGDKGARRLLERYGGRPAHFSGYSCQSQPLVLERNRFWSDCLVRWSPKADAPSPVQLFGAIIERDGKFKFVSYANDF